MRDFSYYNPVRVHFGKDAMAKLPEELGKFGKHVLLASAQDMLPKGFENLENMSSWPTAGAASSAPACTTG